MVYSNRFVLCILINGQVQKELANGTVKIPFGSEYSIRARNKNPERAVVKIFVDGENVSGNGYVVPANDFIDIERHHDKDRAFKFVDLDSPDAVDAGKNGPNDNKEKGTIEVRFYMEKTRVYNTPITSPWESPSPYPYPFPNPIPWQPLSYNNDILRCVNTTSFNSQSPQIMFGIHNASDVTLSCNDDLKDGCTVEGNLTGQNFTSTYVDIESEYTALRVFLQGYIADKVYTHNTATKFCENCGAKKKKKSDNFCSNCGLKF